MARTRSILPFSGSKLRTLREKAGMYQQDLSDATAETGCRVDRAAISKYETGAALPSPRPFRALVTALGCDAEDLLDTEPAA